MGTWPPRAAKCKQVSPFLLGVSYAGSNKEGREGGDAQIHEVQIDRTSVRQHDNAFFKPTKGSLM